MYKAPAPSAARLPRPASGWARTCSPACGTGGAIPSTARHFTPPGIHRQRTSTLRLELLQPSELRKHINVFHKPEVFIESLRLHLPPPGKPRRRHLAPPPRRTARGWRARRPGYGRVVWGTVVVADRPPPRPRPGRSLPGWVGRTCAFWEPSGASVVTVVVVGTATGL